MKRIELTPVIKQIVDCIRLVELEGIVRLMIFIHANHLEASTIEAHASPPPTTIQIKQTRLAHIPLRLLRFWMCRKNATIAMITITRQMIERAVVCA